MLNTIIENSDIIIAILSLIFLEGLGIYTFFKLPTKTKQDRIKAFLLYAVKDAEDKLGTGTGEFKLSKVYGEFKVKFPVFSIFLSYERFKELVDEALKTMQNILS